MHVDHLSFAAGRDGLAATTSRLAAQLGGTFAEGGYHPRFGTQNQILPLAGGRYLEVVEVLDHPAAEKAPFGQAVRARSQDGGGWLGWVVATDDLRPVEQRLGRPAVVGSRQLPDGSELCWEQVGVKGLQADPQLPFFIHWLSDPATHPSVGGQDVALRRIEIAGDFHRLDDWLGGQSGLVLRDLEIAWIAPNGQPGLVAAVFDTPHGEIRI